MKMTTMQHTAVVVDNKMVPQGRSLKKLFPKVLKNIENMVIQQ